VAIGRTGMNWGIRGRAAMLSAMERQRYLQYMTTAVLYIAIHIHIYICLIKSLFFGKYQENENGVKRGEILSGLLQSTERIVQEIDSVEYVYPHEYIYPPHIYIN
jgi:hypothetical protein